MNTSKPLHRRALVLLTIFALLLGALWCAPLSAAAAEDGAGFTSAYLHRAEARCDATPNTFEAWIKLPRSAAADRAGIILGNYGDNTPCINFEIHPSGRPRLYWNGTYDWIFTDINVCTGEWLHLTIVRDTEALQVRCYVNGVKVGVIGIPRGTPDLICPDPFVLGGDLRINNTMFFRGRIRSLAVYSDVRTEQEIAQDMIAPEIEPALLAYYEPVDIEVGQTLDDLSGNGYDLTKIKPITWVSEAQKQPVEHFDYTFVAIGDTQVIAEKHRDRFHLIYDWILEHREEKNIQLVMGLGDITENSSTIEWDVAMQNILRLEGVIPFSLVRGNHDSVASFNRSFPYDQYHHLVDGTYNKSMINSWQYLTVGERQFIIFTLDYGAPDTVLSWASDIIAAHPDHNVIITTHAYLYRDGTTLDQNDVCPPATTGGQNNGDHMWEKLIRKHENIVLVLSGHDPCSRIITRQEAGDAGNIVTQMLIDPQGVDVSLGGVGMVALLHFSHDTPEVTIEYYSTFKEQYFRPENQFTVTLDLVNETSADEQPEPPAQTTPPAQTEPLAPSVPPAQTAQAAPTEPPADRASGSPVALIAVIGGIVIGVAASVAACVLLGARKRGR